MVLVGLTGGIGTGKSTVSSLLETYGARIIDADKIAREVVKPGTPGLTALFREFGSRILGDDGGLDRSSLAQMVFGDPAVRRRVNELLHPLIIAKIHRRITQYRQKDANGVIVIDAPLLLETGLDELVKFVLVVYASEAVQMHRLMKRDKLSSDEARGRIRAQMPLKEKVKKADFVINNDGSVEHTSAQVKEAWNLITADIL